MARPQPDRSGALYGITAWPPADIADLVRRFQLDNQVAAFGEPHFNLRTPFRWSGTEASLAARFREACESLSRFEARLDGWKAFPTALYLAVRPTPAVLRTHDALLAAGGQPLFEGLDADNYVPHVSVALGLLPWSREDVVATAARLPLPRTSWRIAELALTREDGGVIAELQRLPLGDGRT